MPIAVAKKQIVDSRRDLEEMFNIRVETFAYPYGAFAAETVDLVKEGQYSAAVSVIAGVQHSPKDLYYLSRIRAGMIANDSIIQILKKLN